MFLLNVQTNKLLLFSIDELELHVFSVLNLNFMFFSFLNSNKLLLKLNLNLKVVLIFITQMKTKFFLEYTWAMFDHSNSRVTGGRWA